MPQREAKIQQIHAATHTVMSVYSQHVMLSTLDAAISKYSPVPSLLSIRDGQIGDVI